VDFSWPRPRDSLGGTFGGGAMMEGTRNDDVWVDFSWPRPRDSLGGHLGGGAMMEETHDMMIWLGDRVH
jgi:hypothetical protein